MSKLFEEMAQGTAEARASMEGERKGYKVTLPETVDVLALRPSYRQFDSSSPVPKSEGPGGTVKWIICCMRPGPPANCAPGSTNHQFTFDAEGRLMATAGSQYEYNAGGERVSKDNSTGAPQALYLHDGQGNQIAELNASLAVQHVNVYSGKRMIGTLNQSTGKVYYAYSNWLGTKRYEEDGGLACATSWTGLPFGDNLAAAPGGNCPDATEHHFTGQEHDAESGLDHFEARYYQSITGRWLLPDWSATPVAVPYAVFTNPQSLNLYTYVGNNPVNEVDADGHVTPGDGNTGVGNNPFFPNGSPNCTPLSGSPCVVDDGAVNDDAVQATAQQQNSAAGSGGNNPINLNIAGVSVTGSYSVGGIQPASVYGGGISIDVNTDCSVCAWGQVITRTGDGATGPRIDDESYGPFYGDKGRGAQAFGDTPANGVGQKGTFQGVAVLGVGSEKSKSFVPLGAMIYKYSVDGHGNTSMPITPRLATAGEFKQAVQVLHNGSPGFYVPTP